MKKLDPYSIAEAELAALEKAREELLAFLATKPTYERLLARSEPAQIEGKSFAVPMNVERIATAVQRVSKTSEIIDAVMKIIARNNGPMVLSDILQALKVEGIDVGGKNPSNNLGAKLSAEPRLETTRRYGWWFKGEPIPDAAKASVLVRRLEFDGYEEGLDADASRPLQSNGAADLHSA